MRTAFFEELAELGARDERILLLTADLGFRAIEVFADRCPKQFFNVGVCEQNMVGMATGVAEAGFIPFIYSIAPFAVLRPFEFIRNGPVAHRLPVRIVGVGGGLEYGTNGISHYGIEDIGVLRTLPGLQLIAPADGAQVRAALQSEWDRPDPSYIRLSKNQTSTIAELNGRFRLGTTQTIREGRDALILALGPAVYEAIGAAELLKQRGISAGVELVDNLNGEELRELPVKLSRFDAVFTVEAHYINGGLGSFVCELVAERALRCKVVRCGVNRVPDGITGSQAYLHEMFGISAAAIARKATLALSASV